MPQRATTKAAPRKPARAARAHFHVLASDKISDAGLDLLRADPEIAVTSKTDYTPEGLREAIGKYDALIVRSQTRVTADIIEAGKKLQIIARAGVGVDNIDVQAATRRGIVVINSPEGNTIAATEHTLALMLALSRTIPQADASMRRGEWKRSAFMGVEVYNKTVGVIGLGKIGSEVARRCRALGMRVLAYDPFVSREHAERIGAEPVDLPTMLKQSDYVTLHVPKTKETAGMIGAKQLALAKKGLRIINVSRGGVVDEAALAEAIRSGKIAGAAVDVYEQEPPKDSPLLGLDNVILTPHLGASTEEAQVKVAVDVCAQVREVLHGRPARTAVNVSPVPAEALSALEPYFRLAEKLGRLLGYLAEGRYSDVEVAYSGEVADLQISAITPALLQGLLEPFLEEPVNLVNAGYIAENRGITVKESRSSAPADYTTLISVTVTGDGRRASVAGTLFGRKEPRVVLIDDYRVDFVPDGYMVISRHTDKPGVIGRVGTILGEKGINIAGMNVGRKVPRGKAVMALAVDSPIPPAVLRELEQVSGMEKCWLVEL